jgi:hypothetical protein
MIKWRDTNMPGKPIWVTEVGCWVLGFYVIKNVNATNETGTCLASTARPLGCAWSWQTLAVA